MGRFRDALAGPGLGAVAEFKRRSPSAGDIRPDAEVRVYARAYESASAAAMSVLVDGRFGGSWDDLRAARAVTSLPLLAKGFFSSADDLRAAREAGADAALLLLRDLDDAAAASLMRAAADLGLDALVEAHDADEVERGLELGADPLGVNARDLATFAVDLGAQLELVARAHGLAPERAIVAESGVQTRAQAATAELEGAAAVLVGTALMRASDPGAKLAELLRRPLVKVCGLTRQEDVDVAVEAGADLAGFVLVDESPRRAPGVLAVPDGVLSVGVYVGEPADDGADLVQLYEREPGRVRGRDAVLLREGRQVARVVDLPWQEGDADHLARAAAVEGRVMLAGGLAADNVAAAIEAVRPWAVDASSRLERAPGVKDPARVRAYVAAAR
jgi:indole-3-glycerol phosphate synthase/phosphoribosylanthranilate isomerase